MRKKSFTARNVVPTDGLEIEINGRSFPCRPKIAGITILDFTSKMDEEDPVAMSRGLVDFLSACIDPSVEKDWHAFISDPDNDVDIEVLAEIVGYLTEEYTNRPLPQPEPSSNGPAPSGPGVVDVPSAGV